MPEAATPVFAKQGAARTEVGGLTAEGRHVCRLTVVDRTKFSVSDVPVTVGAG